ncbi:UNVERIFIED_CONTAM: hypothetical protein FKN15_049251 [Acipenser sinensis]
MCVLEKGVTDLQENVAVYLKHLERRRLEALVFRPLCTLRELMAGPRNLIRKRLHKLLDFEQIEEKRRSGSVSYEEQEVANTYQALNALLLSELPRLNATGTQLLLNTLGAFSCIQRDLAAEVERLSQGYLQQPLSPSSQQRLRALSLKYRPEQIYQVSSNVGGSRELDLTLPRGELVGVLQEMDTRGDQHRWLVEAGGRRGYVPAGKLKPYHQVALAPSLSPCPSLSPSHSRSPSLSISPSQFPSSQYLSPVVGGAECRRHSYTEMTVTDRTTAPPCFQVLAGYDFSARGSHELSLQAGEPVKVLEPHDKRGSSEWSLVEARGQRGYAPSNYLMVVPMLGGHASAPSSPNLLTK